MAVAALVLPGCATVRDTRTPVERERDAEVWTRAHNLQVAVAEGQVKGCSLLAVVNERYYEDMPGDPLKRPIEVGWPERMLRFKTAQLGGNVALMNATIQRWSGDRLDETRVLGKAYRCQQSARIAANSQP